MKTQTNKPKSASAESSPSSAPAATPPASVLARIEFEHPTARTVCIAGSFNEWHPGATEMISLGEGRWAKELTLPPGTYEYLLVVDGQWVADPKAGATVPNQFGGCNCVLTVVQT